MPKPPLTHRLEVLELLAHELVDGRADLRFHLQALLLPDELCVVLLREVLLLVARLPDRCKQFRLIQSINRPGSCLTFVRFASVIDGWDEIGRSHFPAFIFFLRAKN